MIDINLNFSTDGLPENLTFILAKRDSSKIGLLTNPQDVTASISAEEAPEISVKFYKVDNPYYNEINLYKLIYVSELDTYFSIDCQTNEGENGEYKALTLKRLAESELEQINVYGLQINTEEEIILPDYDSNFPNVLYRDLTDLERYDDIWGSDEKYTVYDEHGNIDVEATTALRTQILRNSSMLHRILSFAPHYSIGTVDESIRDIQRIFAFDGTSIHECFNQIAEEMSIIFDYIDRTVNVYDALSYCNDCGYRGHYTGECPNCGSSDITEGFGDNTGICISSEALGSDLTYQRNSDAMSNCYHVAGGDDIMTAAIWNCNPNGGYVWSFSDETKSEMSSGLRTALNSYETLYDDYQTEHTFDTSALPLAQYNTLIAKYKALDSDVKVDPISSIIGYSELIKAYYDAIDFGEYLNSGLYPSITNNGKSAVQVVAGLTDATLSPVSVLATEGLTLASASNAVVSYARILSDPLFDIKVVSQELIPLLGGYTWTGILSATNYYDKSDTAKTGTLRISIDADIANYAQNSVKQTLLNRSKGNAEIINMYAMTDEELENALKYYSYQTLSSINDCYVKSIEVLTTIGANDPDSDAYQIYTTTQAKMTIINAELSTRENEAKLVDFKDTPTCMTALLKSMIDSAKAIMKLENNLTPSQWIELNAFRRESDYSNDNYVSTSFRKKFDYVDSNFISDALTNAELIKRAYEFLMQAEYKIRENNKYSYSISTTLSNLLVIPEFAKLRDSFKCGNWLRVMDNSGQLYKLRLMKYEIDFNDLSTISVDFADVSLNNSAMNKMQKFMMQTQTVVDRFAKSENDGQSKLVSQSTGLTDDYTYGDAYSGSESYQNIEIMGNQMTTKFNVLDGLIQGKISAQQALSLIAQELGKITLTVQNGNKASTITISYDDVTISTTGNITLGGTVIFSDDLVDGTTVISGDNIMTGRIISANYQFRTGQTFSDYGSLFDLINGNLRTPGLYSDGTTGDLYIKGTIYAQAGRIGDFDLLEMLADGSYAVEHAHSTWKLRSAPIAGQNGKRYYVSLTQNRNLVVSDSKDHGHLADNDKTVECNIGTRKYPWRYGYFNRLYMDGVLLGTEYAKIVLDENGWDANQEQEIALIGITQDNDGETSQKQYLHIKPAYKSAEEYYTSGVLCIQKAKGKLKFKYMESAPTDDIEVFVYAQNAKRKQLVLDAPFNALVEYDRETELAYISWSDPNDELFAVWDRTYLVRKEGSAPSFEIVEGEPVTDGEILDGFPYDEDDKNKYSDDPYIDDEVGTLEKGVYYYSIFAVTSEDNVSSYTDSINTSDAPVITEASNTSCSFELSPNYYEWVKLVYKADSEPETVTDGILLGQLTDLTCEHISNQVIDYEAIGGGTYYLKIFAQTDNGEMESKPYELVIVGSFEFGYTGYIQTFTVPQTGRYQIECWGAQGGNAGTVNGGYGGYSVVEVELQKDEVLYIDVGGQNGYNGGGT